MKNINEKLLKLEEEFDKIKGRREKSHLVFIFAFFITTLCALYFFQKYYSENNYIRYIFFAFILAGLIAHYLLRYSLHRSKNRYKKFFVTAISALKKDISDPDELNESVIESARATFKSREIELNVANLKYFSFWELLFLNLKINL
jgi:hypothetical protein